MNNKEKNEEIQHKLTQLEYVCKQASIDVFKESMSNMFILKTNNIQILFTLSYIEHFDQFSLTIDYHGETFSSGWNLFNNTHEMFWRITQLINFLTKKSLNADFSK